MRAKRVENIVKFANRRSCFIIYPVDEIPDVMGAYSFSFLLYEYVHGLYTNHGNYRRLSNNQLQSLPAGFLEKNIALEYL